jgi:NDP-sugar pyrophosphorylase family protein
MELSEELDHLRAALFQGALKVPQAEIKVDAARATVVIPAGGFGYRMRGATDDSGAVTQKALLPLPNGETLIGRLVREYAAAGFRDFVALVNHEGREVEARLDGGRPWGVEVRCSYDPEETGSGRTGAILNAIYRGIISAGRTSVVHNADCPVLNYPGSFALDLLRTHMAAERDLKAACTIVAVDGHRFPYTGMSIQGGRVTSVEMYPFIPVPAHTGISVLSAEALASVREHAAESRKNFEQDFFPRWSAEGRLAAMLLRHDQWIAVDDRKAYRVFCRAVESELAV